MTKHEQNLRGSNVKFLDFVSFLQKVTLKRRKTHNCVGTDKFKGWSKLTEQVSLSTLSLKDV